MIQITNFLDATTVFFTNDLFFTSLLVLLIMFFIYHIFSIHKLKKIINSIPTFNISQKVFSDIEAININLNKLNNFHTITDTNFSQVFNKLKETKNIKIHKYNPYADMGVGGNQSFSLGILDRNGNGIILTSLYSREKSRSLIKEIKNFVSEQELSPEEKHLITLYTS